MRTVEMFVKIAMIEIGVRGIRIVKEIAITKTGTGNVI